MATTPSTATKKATTASAEKTAATPKTAVKKPAVAKAAVAKPAAAKTATGAAKKSTAAAKKPAAKRAPISKSIFTPEQRYLMIAEAAYYRSERQGFMGDPVQNWVEAEAEIGALFSSKK